jgi:hypothetical protein
MSEQPSSTSHKIKYPHWQRELDAALEEGDPRTLRQRVDAAEAAMFLRTQSLENSPEAVAEQKAISEAIGALRKIQRDKLGYPNWSRLE